MAQPSVRGVVNDTLAIYFADAMFASSFCRPLVHRTEARGRRRDVPGQG